MKKTFSSYLFSFLIPLSIVSIALSLFNIWWGSDTTILASDGFHQYSIFATTLRNSLHGQGSIFYTFTSGLGMNFYTLMSYYLGSFFSPFVYFFDVASMPDALYLFTVIKIGLIGLSTFTSLSRIHQNVNRWLLTSLSTSFALMSFLISQIEITMWLDVFILVPLILLGLHRLAHQKGHALYVFSLATLFIQNYYFGFMTAIFISLWFLVQLTDGVTSPIKRLLDFIISSLLAALLSAVMLVPTYLDLKTNGETLSTLSRTFTDRSWYLDLFAKNLIGSYDTTQFGSIPTIYVGLFPLLLALLFFTLKTIKWQVKLAYVALISVVIASFYLEVLDLLWQGMHAPNMFLHRYSWVFSLIIIDLAARTLGYLQQLNTKKLLLIVVPLFSGYLATFFFKKHYDFLTPENFILTLAFLIAYTLLLNTFLNKASGQRMAIVLTLTFTFFEAGLNSFYQINAVNTEWHFPSREGYANQLTAIDNLVKKSQASLPTFFRTERLWPQTGNDGMKFGFNGLSQFSSVRNRHSSQLLDKFGFRSDGTNLNLRYQNNTLIADSLFGIRYNIHDQEINKYGFYLSDSSEGTLLYENSNAGQLALLTSQPYQDLDITLNTLDNQTNLLNALSGLENNYFYRIASHTENISDPDKRLVTTIKRDDGSTSAQFAVAAKAYHQLYLSIPDITTSNENNRTTQIIIDGQLYNYTRDNVFSLFDLGYYDTDKALDIEVIFPDTTEVSFYEPTVYGLNVLAYQEAMDIINSRIVQTAVSGNQVTITYDSPQDASLLVTLPYDKGWTATLNGQSVPVKAANKGLILLDAKAGQGTVTLTFIPNGLTLGAGLSLSGLLLVILFLWHKRRATKRLSPALRRTRRRQAR